MKLYSKRLITLLLTSSISLSTMGCAIIKSTENEGLKVKNHDSEDENYTIEVVEDKSIIFTQESAVRAITDAEVLNSNNEVIGYLPKDEELKVNNTYEDFYEVFYNDDLAYIKTTDVVEDYITTPQNEYKSLGYVSEDTQIYLDTNESITIKDIKAYELAYIYYEVDDYYYVMADNNIGFMKKDKINNLEDTFVVVDISSQHLDLYKDNEIILSSPVVTGKDKIKPTKIGYHEVYDARDERYLIGDDGTLTYVDVMNTFYDGQGLHDAEYHDAHYDSKGNYVKKHGWRDISEFGGYTFLKHGSHGCVNMPHDKAVELDSYIGLGTKVLVKR